MTPLSRRGRIALRTGQATAFAGLAAYAAQAAFSVCGSSADGFFEDYVYTALLLGAGAFCVARAAVWRAERAPWLVLGAGIIAWAGGEVYYSLFLQDLAAPPLPSVSDALWLLFYPACFVAIVLLVRARVREFRSSLWLDGVIGALAVAAVGAALVMPAISGSGEGSRAVAVDLTYLLGDLLLLGFVVGVFALTGWRPGRAWALLGLGLAVSAVVDAFFLHQSATGSSVPSTAIASLWPASALAVGCAAWQPQSRRGIRIEGWRVLAMPGVFAVAGVAVLVHQAVAPLNLVALGLAAATLLAVIARMAATFRENMRLLERSRREALTDPLTGLGNRRQLMADLDEMVAGATSGRPFALVLFDLDGFKQYNDRFGHPVGDALLSRLGRALGQVVHGVGRAYRLGGDEFCVIASGDKGNFERVAADARAALTDRGKGFSVGSSFGMSLIPTEAGDVSQALRIADERLYAQKGHNQRRSVTRETSSALMALLKEIEPTLEGHLDEVTRLCRRLGARLGLSQGELEDLTRAAELHDIGKVAVPDEILNKDEPLDETEWDFLKQHTLVGDRILSAAPALAPVARLVRASHERYDGTGYPDRLMGEEIPLEARIVAVCDAYDAMTSRRPYRDQVAREEALRELRRCAGRQFDPGVVQAFCEMVSPRRAPKRASNGLRRPVPAVADS